MAGIGAPLWARAATNAAMTTAPSSGTRKQERRLKGWPHARAGKGDSVTGHASTRAPKVSLLQGFLAARIWVITRPLPVAYPPNFGDATTCETEGRFPRAQPALGGREGPKS